MLVLWYFIIGYVVLALCHAGDARVASITDWLGAHAPSSVSSWRWLWNMLALILLALAWWLWIKDAFVAVRDAWR